MSTFHTEHSQAWPYQNNALQRLTASREEISLLSHMISASPVVACSAPLHKAILRHWDLVRVILITLALLMSATLGWLIPRIIDVM